MIADPREYIDQARIAIGALAEIRSAAVSLSQRKTSGYRGSGSGNSLEPTNERDYGLRLWIQKPDGHCYFALFALGDPKKLRSEIEAVHRNDQWKFADKDWPFNVIENDVYRGETSYRDPQIDIVDPQEVSGRFANLARRLSEAVAVPIQDKAIEEYLFRYRMIENEEYLWTTGSKRPVKHSSSRFIIDLQIKIHGVWVSEGFEESQFLNLDWRKISDWANRWLSLLTPSSATFTDLKKEKHIYFSNYATKQICHALHKWTLTQLKYGREDLILEQTKKYPLSKLVTLYDNPREPKVCGRRIWEGRGRYASGVKFWDEGKWVLPSANVLPTRSRGTSDLPEPTLCNLVFAPGRSDYVDLLARGPTGLWIPSLTNVSISNDATISAEGFCALYDAKKYSVSPQGNVKLMAPIFSLLSNIEDVGRHLQWYHSIGTSDWLVNSDAFELEPV
jgi:predicted Zn-dependent protease